MPCWKLSPSQTDALKSIVAGRHVTDLGAGDGSLSLACLKMGAKGAMAVDPNRVSFAASHPKLEWKSAYFGEMAENPGKLDVAIVAWPWEGIAGNALRTIIQQADTVVYLGKNFGGTRCGGTHLWDFLTSREVENVIPHVDNTLICYNTSKKRDKDALLLREEAAALDDVNIHSYDSCPWSSYKRSDFFHASGVKITPEMILSMPAPQPPLVLGENGELVRL